MILFDSENLELSTWYKHVKRYMVSFDSIMKRRWYNKEKLTAYSQQNEAIANRSWNENVRTIITQSTAPDAADDILVQEAAVCSHKTVVIVSNDRGLVARLKALDKRVIHLYTNPRLRPIDGVESYLIGKTE
jgi:hypothetical protein